MKGGVKYQIVLTKTAQAMLASIKDARIRGKIAEKIDGLAHEPEKQGKAMVDDLEKYRSLRAVGQRYRILYQVKNKEVIVIVLAVGIRKDGDKNDIYHLAKKLVKLNLLQ